MKDHDKHLEVLMRYANLNANKPNSIAGLKGIVTSTSLPYQGLTRAKVNDCPKDETDQSLSVIKDQSLKEWALEAGRNSD